MKLTVPQNEADELDFSFDSDWEQLCCDQVVPESLDVIDEGHSGARGHTTQCFNRWGYGGERWGLLFPGYGQSMEKSSPAASRCSRP